LSYGEFHPREDNRFMTCAYDSTVRLWDLQTKRIGMDQNIPNVNCFKCVDARGLCGGSKMFVSTAAYNSDGAQVMAGCSDGSLHMFHEKHKQGKGLTITRSAHGGEITGIKFLFADSQLVTRGMDDCVKFWDLRKLTAPLRTWSGIETARSFSNIAVSPDSDWLLCGTGAGDIACVDLTTGELAGRHKLATRQVIRVEWSGKLNQVISSGVDGNIFFSYSAAESRGGAALFASKKPAKKPIDQVEQRPSIQAVLSYDELIESGEYRENRQGELREVKQRVQVPKSDGSAVLSALEQRRKAFGLEDVQKKLLSFQTEEDEEGDVSRAYKRTQPENILDFSDEKSQVDNLLGQKQYCPKCGLKICSCGFISQPTQGPVVSSKRSRV
jgi:hypothetical protein